jgi:hypothetical protein
VSAAKEEVEEKAKEAVVGDEAKAVDKAGTETKPPVDEAVKKKAKKAIEGC